MTPARPPDGVELTVDPSSTFAWPSSGLVLKIDATGAPEWVATLPNIGVDDSQACMERYAAQWQPALHEGTPVPMCLTVPCPDLHD